MKNYSRTFFLFASLFGFTGVALGAFGAHGLKAVLPPDLLATFETGVRYQMYHTFGLVAASYACYKFHASTAQMAGWFFVVGIVLFSGSLYLLSITGIRTFGFITPFGGVSFLLGWLSLGISAYKKQ